MMRTRSQAGISSNNANLDKDQINKRVIKVFVKTERIDIRFVSSDIRAMELCAATRSAATEAPHPTAPSASPPTPNGTV